MGLSTVEQQKSFSPTVLDALDRSLAPIDPGDDAPAWLVGLGRHHARHVRPLGRVKGAPPALDTRFEWGSITKTVTAMLVACAAVRGYLRLDEPLGAALEEASHLPRWLTLERIATHTARLPAQPPGIYRSWWRDRSNPWAHFSSDCLLTALRKTRPAPERPASLSWRYSNFGYALLGAVLERRTGESYASLVDAWIARPFGLTSLRLDQQQGAALWPLQTGSGGSAVPWDFDGATAAAGALRGSMDELLRWGMLLADPPSALRSAVELIRSCRVELAKPVGNMVGFGLGWAICRVPGSRHEVWMHEGATSGSLSVLTLSIDEQPSVVALARNRGLNVWSMLDPRTRAIEPTLFSLSRLLRTSAQ